MQALVGQAEGDDSCDLISLSTTVDALGQRVKPPRVAFNRSGAV